MAKNYYYNDSSFINTFYSANITLEQYYTNLVFGGETGRIVYSSTEFAFRKRTQQIAERNQLPSNTQISLNTLELPFMNYRGKPVPGTERTWWSSPLNTGGVFIDELGYKIRLFPVTFQYDATLYFHKEEDNFYAFNLVAIDDSNETQVNYEMQIDDQVVANIGVLSYNIDYEPTYNENDWLQQNDIRTIKLDFELQTFLMKSNSSGFAVTEQAILDFYTMHPEYPVDPDEGGVIQDYEQIIEYFS